MPDSPTTAMNVDRMMIGDDDFSRRSSLRSQSIYDYEGTHEGGGADSPGSEKTKNPWEADGASRRSSLSTKPEVMVTGSDGDQNAQNGAGVGKTPMPKLMSLLPAPIPTRFIGKMHAVVAKGKGGIDTISEVSFVSKFHDLFFL